MSPENRAASNKRQREYRAKTGNKNTKKYEKTKKGYLMRAYSNMLGRVTGVQVKKAHLYLGKSILKRQDFYEWSLENKEFNILFEDWEQSSYSRKLSPSINRIDPNGGYTLGNMEWITHSKNSQLGSIHQAEMRGYFRGELSNVSKLKNEEVRYIRNIFYGKTLSRKEKSSLKREMATKFNVSISTICSIVSHRTWKNMP